MQRFATLGAFVMATVCGAAQARAGRAESTNAGATDSEPAALQPSPKERRAVRGRPITATIESDDQATIRRFEASLPSLAAARPPAASARAAAPPTAALAPVELLGEWHGSGDVAPPSTGHGAPISAVADVAQVGLADLYLDYFSKDATGAALFGRAVDRLSSWWPSCETAFVAAGVPPEMAAGALALTGFEIDARGADGEAGPWRLTAEQARRAGLRVSVWIDERRDPVRATEAAATTLAQLHQRFGTWPLALAALHAGPDTIERALQQAPAGDFAYLVSADGPLSRATRLFLAKVGALGHLAFPQGRFAAASRAPTAFVTIDVPGAITLGTVARAHRMSVEALRAVNPALIADRAAPFAAPVAVRLPAAVAVVSRAAIDSARGPDDDVRVVPLRLGESPRLLAVSGGISEREFCRINGVGNVMDLRGAGEVLLPAQAAAPHGDGRGFVEGPADAGDEPPLVAVSARAAEIPGRQRVFYFVVDGDGLDEIAAATGVSVADIVAWNNLDARARLQAKMVLQLFVAPELDRGRVALLDEAQVRAVVLGSEDFHALEVASRGKSRLVYGARAGDTLPKIARRYGLTPSDLARINRMSWNTELVDGQQIVVYAPSASSARETAAGRSQPPKRRETGR